MPKFLLRIVALFLITGLLSDSTMASGITPKKVFVLHSAFENQAITGPLAASYRDRFSGKSGIKISRLGSQMSTALARRPHNISNEWITIVDKFNHFVGMMGLDIAHILGLWHQVSAVIPFNPETGEMLFQVRSSDLVNDPGKIGTFGGHKGFWETELEAAVREHGQELFPTSPDRLIPVGGDRWFRKEVPAGYGRVNREFMKVYLEPLRPTDTFNKPNEETAGYRWLTLAQVRELCILHPNQVADSVYALFGPSADVTGAVPLIDQTIRQIIEKLGYRKTIQERFELHVPDFLAATVGRAA